MPDWDKDQFVNGRRKNFHLKNKAEKIRPKLCCYFAIEIRSYRMALEQIMIDDHVVHLKENFRAQSQHLMHLPPPRVNPRQFPRNELVYLASSRLQRNHEMICIL